MCCLWVVFLSLFYDMKLRLVPALLFVPVCVYAGVEELWTQGVSRSDGWSDFNKVGGWDIEDGDNNLCWAASAANIINWWQNRYVTPSGVPTGEKIWTTFKDSFTDFGSNPSYAFEWWLDGTYRPAGVAEWSQKTALAAPGGYYTQYLNPWTYDGETYTDAWQYMTSPTSVSYSGLSGQIISNLQNGAGLTLSIRDTLGETAHAITLWGVEYDASSNLITKMWLTDSDDEQYGVNMSGLFEVACYSLEANLASSGTETLLAFRSENGWYNRSDRDFYVTSFNGLLPANFLLAIPEPSAFGLLAGIGALVLVALRRRRKYFTPEAFLLGEKK